MDSLLALFRLLLKQNIRVESISCNYCSKKIAKGGYRYKCLECDDYDLCTHCFESKKCNDHHESNHIFAIFYNDELLFGEKQSSNDEYHVEKLNETYKTQVHNGVKCNICNQEPIKGLRLKCAFCNNFDVCYGCRSSTSNTHLANHSYILYCKTVQSIIDKSDVTFTDKDKLGSGAFGTVYKARYNDQTVACKIIREEASLLNLLLGQGGNLKKSYLRELEAYNQIKGENIIRMIGHCTYTEGIVTYFMILTEFMSKGSLDKLLENEPILTPRRRFNIAADVAAGMSKIHKLSFIHKDIRPANIFISSQYVAKIGDMGIARMLDTSNLSLLGPVRYMPPEFYTRTYTHKLDVYTFGLTLVELFDGKHTIKDTTISVSKRPTALWDIIERCLSKNASRRPTSSFLDERLDFFKRYINEKIDSNKEYFQTTHENRCRMFMSLYSEALSKYEEKCEEESKESKNENHKIYMDFFENEYKIKEAFYNYKPHIDLLYIIKKIAGGYYTKKDFDQCNSYCLRGLELAEKLNKEDTVLKSDFLSLIGVGLVFLKKDPIGAINYFKMSLNMRKQLFVDEENLKIASSFSLLGKAYFEMKENKEALNNLLKVYDIRKKIYDDENPYLEDTLATIAKVYKELNDFENFEKYYLILQRNKRRKFQQKNFGQEFCTIFLVRGKDNGKPAWHYVEIKDDQKLLELHRQKEGTNIDVADYGEIVISGWGEDPSALVVKNINSSYEDSKEELSIAGLPNSCSDDDNPLFVKLFTELIDEWDFYSHKPSLDVLKWLEFIQQYYFSIRDSRNAILYGKKRLEMSIKLFTEENEYTSSTRYDLGRCLRKLDSNYEEALENLKISQANRENLFGKDNLLVAASIFEIAECYYDQKKFQDALKLSLNALEIREKVYDANNPFLAFSLDQVSKCYEKLDNVTKYLDYRNRSLEIKRILFKKSHPDSDYCDYFKTVAKEENSVSTWKIVLIKDEQAFQELKKNKRNVDENIQTYGEVIQSGKGDRPPKKVKETIGKQYGWF